VTRAQPPLATRTAEWSTLVSLLLELARVRDGTTVRVVSILILLGGVHNIFLRERIGAHAFSFAHDAGDGSLSFQIQSCRMLP
jgi:hypothetical protein